MKRPGPPTPAFSFARPHPSWALPTCASRHRALQTGEPPLPSGRCGSFSMSQASFEAYFEERLFQLLCR